MIKQYHAPLASESPATVLGWLREAVTEAKNFHQKQPGWAELDSDLELISRHQPNLDSSNLLPSWLNVGNTKARIGDIVSTLSNLRPLWQVETGVKELQEPIKILNKCSWAWWNKVNADLKVRSALQWSAVCRTGYLWPRWNPHYYGLGQGEIDLIPLGPKSVYCLWMPEDYDYQKSYIVFIAESVPITQAIADYPLYADKIKPSIDDVGLVRRWGRAVASAVGADALFMGSPPKTDATGCVPSVIIYHAYIRDMTINHAGRLVQMGDPSTKWFYEVPFIGQPMPTGFVNPYTGEDTTRRAQDLDCYLYPNRRLISFTDTCVLYDGPSREYHGLAPVVKFTLDPWPWDFLGGSMVRDVRPIDDTINQRLRGINKSAEMRRNPPKMVNEEVLADSEQGNVGKIVDTNIGEPGATIKAKFTEGDPVRAILPYQNYSVEAWEFQYLQHLDAKADFVLGRAQLEALAIARQMPAGDTQEKWLQATGARTTAKSRCVEEAMKTLGYIVSCQILQWWDAPKRVALFGMDGLAKQDFDYDPNTLIPDRFEINSGGYKADGRSSLYQYRFQRARLMSKMISLEIEPMSMHEITSMTRQLQYMRLYEGMHFPMDSWTLADQLNIQNMGSPPQTEGDTIPERYMAESEVRAQATAMLQAKAQMIMAQANPMQVVQQAIQQDPQGVLQMVLQAMNAGGGSNGGSEGGGPNGATGRPEGRPSSYQEPPQIFDRSDGQGGTRTVIATSER